MINKICKIPRKVTIAFSGGVDSVAVTNFLLNGKHDVTLAFFDHGTKTSADAKKFVIDFSEKYDVPVVMGVISSEKNKSQSQEEFWSIERYKFLNSLTEQVITCHHLDDAIETWIFSSLHGEGKLIPVRNKNVIRPFLTTKKSEFISWCTRKSISWIEDESNQDIKYMRNLIRRDIVPLAMQVNPGLHKVLYKKYMKEFKNEHCEIACN